jgi:hypothetical protein
MNNVCLSTVTVKVVVASQYPDACGSLPATHEACEDNRRPGTQGLIVQAHYDVGGGYADSGLVAR